jgi:hypothetical protein
MLIIGGCGQIHEAAPLDARFQIKALISSTVVGAIEDTPDATDLTEAVEP